MPREAAKGLKRQSACKRCAGDPATGVRSCGARPSCPPEPAPGTAGDPARLWGITLVASDLTAVAAELEHVGAPRDAVQPGRRIAVVAREAGLGVRVALMTPRT